MKASQDDGWGFQIKRKNDPNLKSFSFKLKKIQSPRQEASRYRGGNA